VNDKEFVKHIQSISFIANKIGHKATNKDVLSICNEPDSVTADICRDKVMFKHATEGNRSDKRLNADVTMMHREKKERENTAWRESKQTKITELKKRYKAKYGVEA